MYFVGRFNWSSHICLFFKRKFFVFNRWWCVFCWVLCLVWNFEWPNWWDCLFHCLSWEVPRGLVTWLRPPPVQLAQQKSLRYSEGEIMQRTARKSGFLLKYRAQTTHPLSVCPVSTLQFSSGFLPILIWISPNSHLDFSEPRQSAISLAAIFQPRRKDSKSLGSRSNGMQ